MNLELLQIQRKDLKKIIDDLETKRDTLGDDLVDAEILKFKEKIKQIENKIEKIE